MGAGDLGAAREVEALAGEVADVADEQEAGALVDGGSDVVDGDVVVASSSSWTSGIPYFPNTSRDAT